MVIDSLPAEWRSACLGVEPVDTQQEQHQKTRGRSHRCGSNEHCQEILCQINYIISQATEWDIFQWALGFLLNKSKM